MEWEGPVNRTNQHSASQTQHDWNIATQYVEPQKNLYVKGNLKTLVC